MGVQLEDQELVNLALVLVLVLGAPVQEAEHAAHAKLVHQVHLVMLDPMARMVMTAKQAMSVLLVNQLTRDLNHHHPYALIHASLLAQLVHPALQDPKAIRDHPAMPHHQPHQEKQVNLDHLVRPVHLDLLARIKTKVQRVMMEKSMKSLECLAQQVHLVHLAHSVHQARLAPTASQAPHQHQVHQAMQAHLDQQEKIINQAPKAPMDQSARKVHAIIVHLPEHHLDFKKPFQLVFQICPKFVVSVT
jgi:hypothetical protein